jgi:hypothetical protein
MEVKAEKTYTVKIYLAGDIDVIKQECRRYCKEIGLCVTVNPTLFIYTGGEEFGVEIGLINYPRFPDTQEGIKAKAIELASRCRDASCQHSYLILDPIVTIFNSTRKS